MNTDYKRIYILSGLREVYLYVVVGITALTDSSGEFSRKNVARKDMDLTTTEA
jgi:hypothetical protein